MTEDTASALGVRSRLGFGEVPQRARRHPCPFLLDRRIAALAPACARLELVYALPREPRIRAHVLLCWLALLLIRVSERRTGQTWPTLARELGRLHAVTLTGPTGPVAQTTELTTAQQGILRACGLTPPPRITAVHPA